MTAISQKIYKALRSEYPTATDKFLESMTGSSRGMISKMRSGDVLGLTAATWLSKNHAGYEQLRVDAYAVDSANRAKGSRKSQENRSKKLVQKINVLWPMPVYTIIPKWVNTIGWWRREAQDARWNQVDWSRQ